ncbi:MAG TPA: acetyl-CoA C-acyltransferase [Dehalococcoidia bacterium]|nr:acetyl-CoA C-acyltransferase [Dehalococcoidia bacterium]
MEDVVIVSGVRTAIGRYGGGFVGTGAAELGATVIREAVSRAGVEPQQVDQVVMGCAGQFGEDAYLSRVAAVNGGLPQEVPAYTVNRLCGSGLEAINTAARWIETGDADVIVAGGAENMSRYPYLMDSARWGARMGNAEMSDGLLQILNDPFNRYHMGVTAENMVDQWNLSREALDEFSVGSHEKAVRAIDEGLFKDQIVPVEVKKGRKTEVIDTDEHPRRDASLESMGGLRPAFSKEGHVTAGNASGINDGAAAVVMMSAKRANELGVKPLLRLVGRANSGVDPTIMGTGPIPATQRVMERTGLSPDDMDVIELNEAFASVALVCSQELGLNSERTNPNGGAVALGHPVGATGAVLTVKTLFELQRTGGTYGLVTLCIGGGQGIASVFERLN